jgi:hypothetical protein
MNTHEIARLLQVGNLSDFIENHGLRRMLGPMSMIGYDMTGKKSDQR